MSVGGARGRRGLKLALVRTLVRQGSVLPLAIQSLLHSMAFLNKY